MTEEAHQTLWKLEIYEQLSSQEWIAKKNMKGGEQHLIQLHLFLFLRLFQPINEGLHGLHKACLQISQEHVRD